VNDVFERLLRVTNEEVEGKTIQQVWPDFEANSLKSIGRVVMSGVPEHFEMKHSPSGKRLRCQVYRPDGNQERFYVILVDIDSRKENYLPSEPA
jgi:PAS domain-containing protein